MPPCHEIKYICEVKTLGFSIVFLVALRITNGQVYIEDDLRKKELRSLYTALENSTDDTARIRLSVAIGETVPIFRVNYWDSLAVICNKKLKNIRQADLKKYWLLYMGKCLNNCGFVYNIENNRTQALAYYDSSMRVQLRAGQKGEAANAISNMAVIYKDMGDIKKSLEYMHKTFAMLEGTDDVYRLATALNNIAQVYNDMGDNMNAIEHYIKALDIYEKVDNKEGIALVYGNLGIVHLELKNYKVALSYLKKAADFQNRIGDIEGYARSLNNIAVYYQKTENYREAVNMANKSLDVYLKTKDYHGISMAYVNRGVPNSKIAIELPDSQKKLRDSILTRSYEDFKTALDLAITYNEIQVLSNIYNNLAYYYVLTGDIEAAEAHANSALKYADSLNYSSEKRDAYMRLSDISEKKGDFRKAFYYYKYFILYRDSVENTRLAKAAIQQDLSKQFREQKLNDSLIHVRQTEQQQSRIQMQEADLKRESLMRYVLIGAGLLAVIIAVLAFRAYRSKRKDHEIIKNQKIEVQYQKELIEEKHQEISDSIHYARRIQRAILPAMNEFRRVLPQSFVLYLPKDVVAGDFYWLESVVDRSAKPEGGESIVLLAAADCTGHGVPGAMVSVVCNNALNRAVREYGLTVPGEILDKTREIVIAEFEKSEDDVKDGMDISLCSLTSSPPKEGLGEVVKLQWAGANNPLWIIREGELIEYKPDKQPIGKFTDAKSFTTKTMELQKGDTLYIFTDGYQDQFGGEKGKKFKAANLKQLLLPIQHENMDRQCHLLAEAFEKWREGFEQVDDVCVIGVRL